MAENQPTVLVIEDEVQIRRFLRATLTANGYTLPSDTSQNYTWAVAAGVDALSSAPIFTITFTPINGQSSDVTLTLDNQGTKTPIASWSH